MSDKAIVDTAGIVSDIDESGEIRDNPNVFHAFNGNVISLLFGIIVAVGFLRRRRGESSIVDVGSIFNFAGCVIRRAQPPTQVKTKLRR